MINFSYKAASVLLTGIWENSRTSLYELCSGVRLVVDVGDDVEYVYASEVLKSGVLSSVSVVGFDVVGKFDCVSYMGRRVIRIDVLDAGGNVLFQTDAGGLVIDRAVLALNLRVGVYYSVQ